MDISMRVAAANVISYVHEELGMIHIGGGIYI